LGSIDFILSSASGDDKELILKSLEEKYGVPASTWNDICEGKWRGRKSVSYLDYDASAIQEQMKNSVFNERKVRLTGGSYNQRGNTLNLVVHSAENLTSELPAEHCFCRVSLVLSNNSVVIENEIESKPVELTEGTVNFDTCVHVEGADGEGVHGIRVSVWAMDEYTSMLGSATVTMEDYLTLDALHQKLDLGRGQSVRVSYSNDNSLNRDNIVRRCAVDNELARTKDLLKVAEDEKEKIAELFYQMGEDPKKVSGTILKYFDGLKKSEKKIMEMKNDDVDMLATDMNGNMSMNMRLETELHEENFENGDIRSVSTSGTNSHGRRRSQHFVDGDSMRPRQFKEKPLDVKSLHLLGQSVWAPNGEMIHETKDKQAMKGLHHGVVPEFER